MSATRRRVLAALATGGSLLAGGCLGQGGGGAATTAGPDALGSPYRGAEESAVVVRAWEDFACPHCREYNETVVPKLQKQYLADGTVRYEHHDFPIPVTKWSWPAAIAARSVQASAGNEAFWTFTEGAFASQNQLGWSLIRDLADRAGVDPDAVESDARQERWRPVVDSDRSAGRDRGVEGTPTVFVGDAKVPYGKSWDGFYQNIADAIERQRDA
ncbi:MAG: DsbA family protein [Haloarculaceae archaeon]